MPVEFRILSGARAGQFQRFAQAVVLIGRHQETDLRFDPKADLDVSSKHAELRGSDGRYEIHDRGSTNGTYVNGKKVEGSVLLKDGDTITFGAKGPQAEVRFWKEGEMPPDLGISPRSTEQRIAIAVKQQTKGIQRYLLAALGVVALGVAAAFYFGRRAADAKIEELQKQIAANDSMRLVLQSSMRGAGDTAFANELQRKLSDMQAKLPLAGTDAERARIEAEIEDYRQQLGRMVQMDLPTIHRRNAPAVVILISDIDGKNSAGTGFAISADGLILTNRHNVQDLETKAHARRIAVKFTNTREWLRAKIIKVSEGETDLALIQIDHEGREGPFPLIEGISRGAEATEGVPVVTIGYPLGYDTPMEGAGNDFEAKSTLNPGTVSKKTSSILQIDSFAAHGSSGSPVFSTRGLVVGVVYGGQADAGGKIVYAVTPEKLIEFLPDSLRSLVRD